ncbi:MAG TPA: 50S ribosomal protein L15 [Acidimicrobiales bacterium]|jgi:large subunit ribosomal protein L15|nr:50S ribosomal protein L15 [Acidimicrobiales bacterium]
MKLHELAPPKGATKAKQRVGRGTGGKGHKTAGRGTKGQHARNTVPAGFEGGQLPLMQRIPKLKGFKNPFRVAYTPVNVGALAALEADQITLETMVAAGLCRPKALVKVLGQGALSRPVRVSAHAFSASAEAAITTAGGSVERVPLPFGNGRPPASGNALMNR